MDTTYRAHLMGYRLAVALDLPMLHMSHGSHGDAWKKYAAAFNQKHAATLARTTPRVVGCASVLVPSKAEAIAVMTAQYEVLDS
jgi:GT2 family glycosyltransferase